MDTTTTIESPAEKKALAAKFWAMLVAFYEAIAILVRRLLGLAVSTAGELKGEAADAVDTARRGVEATGRIVGRGLSGPAVVLDATASAVGNVLGSLLPRAPVTAADVARGAVARDDHRQAVGYAPTEASASASAPALTLPSLIKAHARAALDWKGEKAKALPPLDARHSAWIASLSLGERLSLSAATPETIARHLDATSAGERILGVSAVPSEAMHYFSRARIESAMALLEAAPSRPEISPRALGFDDEPEAEPIARFGR